MSRPELLCVAGQHYGAKKCRCPHGTMKNVDDLSFPVREDQDYLFISLGSLISSDLQNMDG